MMSWVLDVVYPPAGLKLLRQSSWHALASRPVYPESRLCWTMGSGPLLGVAHQRLENSCQGLPASISPRRLRKAKKQVTHTFRMNFQKRK
jgi:hypothetical protein